MIITTARKPSSKTRIFCKHLSRFTGWEYVTRGKTSLEMFADEPFLLVGEHKGNPGSFNFYTNGNSVLSIHFSVSMEKDTRPGEEPTVDGESPLASAFSEASGLKMTGTSERIIRANDKIEFIDKDVPVIILKVLGKRGEGIV
jgi:U3 small nucleolar ribonucleoprotein protein IMP4